MKYKFNIKNLDCANCAREVEKSLNEDKKINKAVVNFNTSTITVETDVDDAFSYVKETVAMIEPDAILSEEKIESDNNKDVYRLLIAAVIGILGIVIKISPINMILIVVAYIILIYKTLLTALKQLKNRKINENFLVSISAIGAYLLGKHHEGLMVIFLYELGKMLEAKAVSRSRNSVSELMNIKEESSNLKVNNKIKKVPTTEVSIGDIIVVKEGERVPLDGIVIKGNSLVDTSFLTGESIPVSVKQGSVLLSGSINKGDILEIKVTSLYKDSTVSKILELVENATERKAKAETIVSKYSSKYTLAVIIIALLVSFVLPLVSSLSLSKCIYKGLTILVISCPCAIAISVPLSYFSGIGRASKEGILVKGSNYLDSIKDISDIAFDKTGTITTGEFCISKINIYDKKYNEDKIMEIFTSGEALSNHPIAKSILKKHEGEVDFSCVKNFKEVSGSGISFTYRKDSVKIGSAKFCKSKDVNNNIYLSINDKVVASLVIEDDIKNCTIDTISKLKELGINVYMFTGDSKDKAISIASKVGIDNVNYEMLPEDKYNSLEHIIKNKRGVVAFVGDGINDAPVVKLADLGISMGLNGSDSAIEASDIVIMNDDISKILNAIKISKKTSRIIKENLIFALGIKISVLILAILGLTSMFVAVFADVGVTILCILNTLRILKNN
ncbi:MAG: cadmium-translocating P-type ATPase [Tenericutes bacterium]|nr:cadmium-translocating P-type ATPase [Mycoplasmatota bacterium]